MAAVANWAEARWTQSAAAVVRSEAFIVELFDCVFVVLAAVNVKMQ
jgi:hypothetical protein